MARTLSEIRAHLRAVADNPAVSTTLIQTEDLLALCDASEPRTHDIEMAVLAALMHHKPNYRSPKRLDEAARVIASFVVDRLWRQ